MDQAQVEADRGSGGEHHEHHAVLAARMRDEAVAKQAVLVLPPFIGAWAHKPAAAVMTA